MLFTGALWSSCSKIVFSIHWKTPVMASFFSTVVGQGLQEWKNLQFPAAVFTFLKKTLIDFFLYSAYW